ncbi:MAG TPA: hypothetical protein ENH82_09625 [bacterium]|nr:hypothetical protein [bacterium]
MNAQTPTRLRYSILGSEGGRLYPDCENKREKIRPIGSIDGMPVPEATAVLHRIVTCYNACEGISNEALEGGVVQELVEAVDILMNETIGRTWNFPSVSRVRNTLAKAKGE